MRKATTALAAFGAAFLTVPVVTLQPVAHAASSDQLSALVSSFSECTAGSGSADVLVLLDQSLSLRESDPQNLRAPAAADFVDQLREFAEDSEARISVQVAGFDGNFHAGKWREANGTSAGDLRSDVERMGRQADGRETDYVNALDGARGQLAAQGADCQMLIFFTDGEYDVDGSYGAKQYSKGSQQGNVDWTQVEQEGKQLLCDGKRGPLNSLRKSGVYLVGVGLEHRDAGQLDFLRKVASGEGCGSRPEDSKWAFLEAADARSLVFELGRVTSGPNYHSGGTDSDGKDGFEFGLDPIITSASVMTQAGSDDLQTLLVDPKGKVVGSSEDETRSEESGIAVQSIRLGPATTRFRLTAASGRDLAGTWTVRWLPKPGKAAAKGVSTEGVVNVRSDLRPMLVDPAAVWQAGETVAVKAQVESKSTGEVISADRLPSAKLSLDYRDSTGRVVSLQPSTPLAEWVEGLPIAQDLPQGDGRLALVLSVEMQAKPTTALLPQARSYPLQVKPPANYPAIAASLVTMTSEQGGVAEGVDPSVGTIAISGPGCVWLDPANTSVDSLPQGLSEQQIRLQSSASSQEACVRTGEGETSSIEIQAVSDVSGYGAYSGTLTLQTLPSDGSGEPVPVTVAFVAERADALSRGTQVGVFLLALLLGLGIPAAILFGVRARTARIPVSDPEGGDLAYVVKTVAVSDTGVEAMPLTRQDVRLAHDGSVPAVRQLVVEGVELAAVPFGNPFTIAHVRATAARTLISDGDAAESPGGAVRLPLALEGHWLAWRENAGVRVVYFFSTNDLRGSDLTQLSADLHESLNARAVLLARSPDEPPTPVTTTPGPHQSAHGEHWGNWESTGGSQPSAWESGESADDDNGPGQPGGGVTPPGDPWDDGWGKDSGSAW